MWTSLEPNSSASLPCLGCSFTVSRNLCVYNCNQCCCVRLLLQVFSLLPFQVSVALNLKSLKATGTHKLTKKSSSTTSSKYTSQKKHFTLSPLLLCRSFIQMIAAANKKKPTHTRFNSSITQHRYCKWKRWQRTVSHFLTDFQGKKGESGGRMVTEMLSTRENTTVK